MSCVRENSPPLESELDASCAGGPLSLPAGRAHPHTHGATSTPISSPGNDAHQSPTAGELSNCFHNTTNEQSWAAAEQINKHMPYSYSCQGISRWAALLNHSSAECGIMKLPWGPLLSLSGNRLQYWGFLLHVFIISGKSPQDTGCEKGSRWLPKAWSLVWLPSPRVDCSLAGFSHGFMYALWALNICWPCWEYVNIFDAMKSHQ